MTASTAAQAAYVVAALLFILSLAGLSRHETAPAGNTFGIAGMAIALVATLVLALTGGFNGLQLGLLIAAMAIGATVGLFRAARVPMTGMPELIALFHSFVGLAAVLVGWNGYLEVEAEGGQGFEADLLGIHHAEVVIGVFIGAAAAGVLGAFLAAPITATLKVILSYVWHKVNLEDPYPDEAAPFGWYDDPYAYQGKLRLRIKLPDAINSAVQKRVPVRRFTETYRRISGKQ